MFGCGRRQLAACRYMEIDNLPIFQTKAAGDANKHHSLLMNNRSMRLGLYLGKEQTKTSVTSLPRPIQNLWLQLVKYFCFVLRIEVVRTKKIKVEIHSRLTHLKALIERIEKAKVFAPTTKRNTVLACDRSGFHPQSPSNHLASRTFGSDWLE